MQAQAQRCAWSHSTVRDLGVEDRVGQRTELDREDVRRCCMQSG